MDSKEKIIGDINCEIRKLPTSKLRELEAYLATTFASTLARPDTLEENVTSDTLEENVTRPLDTSTVATLENVDSGKIVHMDNIVSENQDNNTSTSISQHSLHQTVKLVSNLFIYIV